jgi:hypothetical protein
MDAMLIVNTVSKWEKSEYCKVLNGLLIMGGFNNECIP